jgi:O-antigen/teichoic acid export membrane protein
MNREFLLNIFFLVFINLLVKPFYVFGIERTIQDRVGPAAYGLYATFYSFSFLFFMLNDFGIHYFNNTAVARHPPLLRRLLPHVVQLKSVLSALFLALVFLAAWWRGFDPALFPLLFFVALNHIFVSWVAYFRSNLSGLGMYRTDSVLSMLDKLLLTLLAAGLLWGGWVPADDFQIRWFVHAQNLAWGLTALVAGWLVWRQVTQPIDWHFRKTMVRFLLRKAAPYALAVFLMTAYTRMDVVLLEWLSTDGLEQAGIYAAAYRLLDAFNAVAVLFAGLLLPMFSKLLSDRATSLTGGLSPQESLENLLRTGFHLILAGTATLSLACAFFSDPLMRWLYPATATPYYGEVLRYIILTLVPFSGLFIFSTLLTAHGSLRKMNVVFLAGIACNLLLNLVLIPRWQAVGAAVAAFATQSLVLSGMLWLTHRELSFPLRRLQPGRILAFLAALTLADLGLAQQGEWPWGGRFALALGIGALLALGLQLVRFQALRELVRPRQRQDSGY